MNDKNTYNIVPYFSKSFSETTPIKQASCLKLLGFDAPDITKARILELGCSYGGNIIPLAINYPNCEIVGVDLSQLQIEEGSNIIDYLKLDNIKLYHKNILDIDESFGKFDYIICHGVYSWVPDNVKEGILKVISNHLTDTGSALVSYNCYPGWKKIDILRDAMKFRIDGLREMGIEISENQAVSYGIGILDFLKEHSLLSSEVKDRIDLISSKSNHYIYHEYLEEYNDPLYFTQFAKQLEKQGLIHVIDTHIKKSTIIFNTPQSDSLEKECENNYIMKEQYLDFLHDVQFRHSIITKATNKSKINLTNTVICEHLAEMYVRGRLAKAGNDDYFNDLCLTETNLNLAMLKYISDAYPNTIQVRELMEKFGENVCSEIIQLIYHRHIKFYHIDLKWKNSLSGEVKLKPAINRYLQYFSECEKPAITLANFENDIINVELSQEIYSIFNLFDGTKTKEEITQFVIENYQWNNKPASEFKIEVEKLVNSIEDLIITNMFNE